MTDRPILFSAPMVRALLEGRKTQTRRVITSARVFATPERPAWSLRGEDLARAMQNADRFRRMDGDGWFWEADAFEWQAPHTRTGWLAHIGYAPGDRLYVREHWRCDARLDKKSPSEIDTKYPGISYIATGEPDDFGVEGRFRQGMHMPRWASRLTLIVTEVRVQRLQEISEADALAEGITKHGRFFGVAEADWDSASTVSAVDAYANLWDSLNADRGYGWAANPWVVAYSFTVHHGNIDQIGGAS